jgi:hypothetical protein
MLEVKVREHFFGITNTIIQIIQETTIKNMKKILKVVKPKLGKNNIQILHIQN